MNDVFVTCIKNGRFDQFGLPLVSGLSYTLQWGLARDLWLSGYVSVTNSSVFDDSSVDIRRPNLAAELAAISAPVPLWVCGMPFVLFAGDGGANGMLFTGTAGNFTLSAAVMAGFVIPVGYCYLPANAGGLGNAAGWFYFEMSSTIIGTVYNKGFIPSPGNLPAVPATKTAFANPAGGRITQTISDITLLSCSLGAGAMGANGLLKVGIKTLGSSSASAKNSRIYADVTQLHAFAASTSPVFDYEIIIQNAGNLGLQTVTRSNAVLGAAIASIGYDLAAFDFANACTLSVTIGVAANTDTFLIVPRFLTLQAKA